jgi:glycosidase
VFSCTWKGVPLIYSGQELPNKKRLEFFEKDAIKWTGTFELQDFYKTLLNLRSAHPALHSDGEVTRLRTSDDGSVLAYLRKSGEREVLVLLNLSAKNNLRFELNSDAVKGNFKNVFSGAANDFTSEKNFEMQAWEFLVYEK